MDNGEQRLTKLEISVGEMSTQMTGLATQMSAFISESAEHRKRVHADQTHVWEAIEKLGNKGQISWREIVMTGGFIMALITGAAAVNAQLMEGRIMQVEIRELGRKELADERQKNYELDHSLLLQTIRDLHPRIN